MISLNLCNSIVNLLQPWICLKGKMQEKSIGQALQQKTGEKKIK
jgi:hypothetical protein